MISGNYTIQVCKVGYSQRVKPVPVRQVGSSSPSDSRTAAGSCIPFYFSVLNPCTDEKRKCDANEACATTGLVNKCEKRKTGKSPWVKQAVW